MVEPLESKASFTEHWAKQSTVNRSLQAGSETHSTLSMQRPSHSTVTNHESPVQGRTLANQRNSNELGNSFLNGSSFHDDLIHRNHGTIIKQITV